MPNSHPNSGGRGALKRILASGAANLFLIGMAVYALLLYFDLSSNRSRQFELIDGALQRGDAVMLAPGMNETALAKVLLDAEYVPTEADARFAARYLGYVTDSLNDSPEQIGELFKRKYQVPAALIPADCKGLQQRLQTQKDALEHGLLPIASTFKAPEIVGDSASEAAGSIRVRVTIADTNVPDTAAYVRLMTHRAAGDHREDELLAIEHVDANGWATFTGLPMDRYYSVLPINASRDYGSAQGTTRGDLATTAEKQAPWYKLGTPRQATFHFEGQPIKVRLFTAGDIKRMRRDADLTVRTPKQYFKSLRTSLVLVVGAFALLFLAVWRRRPDEPGWLKFVAALAILSCISLINMYGLGLPLADQLYGSATATGILVGVVLMIALVHVNMLRFYMNRYRIPFDPMLRPFQWAFGLCERGIKATGAISKYTTDPLAEAMRNASSPLWKRLLAALGTIVCLPFVAIKRGAQAVAKAVTEAPKGTGYLLLALLLTCLLFTPLGGSVGGMRVNLKIPGLPSVQPSEVSKFLMVIFLAAFFEKYASLIRSYSGHGGMAGVDKTWTMFGRRFKVMGGVLLGICALMGVYMVLSDMGPALVILVTFAMLYSLVKSEATARERMLQSDVAIMIGGVLSFVIVLWAGAQVDLMGVAALAWFALWIGVPWVVKRKTGRGFGVYESAVIFNVIIALFIFGGDILQGIGMQSEAERFHQRLLMCTNTWGVIGGEFSGGEPTSNSQVASGLWALAQGGFSGMGMGMGAQQYVPAFNTDMVLLSFGENAGWMGIVLVLALYAMLLSLTLNIGYRSGHTFTLYLCMGISIVTAVQLLVIIMGSLGLIPLTGVTVALMSAGMSSQIMNYIGFGLVAAVAAHPKREAMTEAAQQSLAPTVRASRFPISVVKVTTCVMLVVIALAALAQATWRRDDVIVRPVYAYSANGMPAITYNPRIGDVTRQMRIGNIYDRNGLLLATSDPRLVTDRAYYKRFGLEPDTSRRQTRYYPFGHYTYFMTGDLNHPIFGYSDAYANGYLADNQHYGELRGYNDHLLDAQGRPQYVQLVGDKVRRFRFCPEVPDTTRRVPLRDYRDVLEYVKAGPNSARLQRFNDRQEGALDFGKVQPNDLWLTIDANLQAKMEDNLAQYLSENFSKNFPDYKLLRASVVVLNAQTGELLSSSNYPPLDLPRLRNEIEERQALGRDYYADNGKPKGWTAYTDQDLGLVYKTMPGSSAKVLSGMSYFRAHPDATVTPVYNVHPAEIIHNDNGPEPTGRVGIERAYTGSSNVYFIHLVNDKHLYPQLAELYQSIGAQVGSKGTYNFDYAVNDDWTRIMTDPEFKSYDYYNKYLEAKAKDPTLHVKMNKTQRDHKGKKWYFPAEWSWAWGQNDVRVAPLSMARLLSAVANDGKMPVTQFVLGLTPTVPGRATVSPTAQKPELVELISPHSAEMLQGYLKSTVRGYSKLGPSYSTFMGGKTGTPMVERGKVMTQDGWFVCFIEDASVPANKGGKPATLAVAVRLERGKASGYALLVTRDVVVPTLRSLNYLPN